MGGLLRIRPKTLLYVVPGLVALIVATIWRNDIRKLHEQVHCYLYAILVVLATSMAASAVADKHYPDSVEFCTAVRRLLDPVCQLALGVLVYSHRHDMRPVGLVWHQFQGVVILSGAVVQFLSIQVHDQHGFLSTTARLYRMLYSFLWYLQGMTLLTMAIILYAFNHGGLHHMVYLLKQPDGFEEMCSYVALDLLLAMLWMSVLLIRQRRNGTYDMMDELCAREFREVTPSPLFGRNGGARDDTSNGNGVSNGIHHKGDTIGNPLDEL